MKYEDPTRVRVSVVIPAYNEAAAVANVARRARRYADQVIVVDDGSSDGTAQCVQGLGVALLRNEANQGKATSLWRGMQWALEAGADVVITLDGDGQHCPEDIPRLIAAAARHPSTIIIGARLRGRRRAPRLRRLANGFADFGISWAAGYRIMDSQSGFRLYPAPLLKRICVAYDRARGFVFESEILIEAAGLGVFSAAVEIDSIYHSKTRPSHYRACVDTARIMLMVGWKLMRRGLYPRGLLRILRARTYKIELHV